VNFRVKFHESYIKEGVLAELAASNVIRDFLVRLHKSYLPNVEEMRKAAKATGLSLSTVSQATTGGKGSAVTHGLLICYGLKIRPETLESLLPKFRKVFAGSEKLSVLDEKFQQVLRLYSVDEMIVALETMLAKDKIERSLGLKKKSGRPPKQKAN
jgi:hypothetical protein